MEILELNIINRVYLDIFTSVLEDKWEEVKHEYRTRGKMDLYVYAMSLAVKSNQQYTASDIYNAIREIMDINYRDGNN